MASVFSKPYACCNLRAASGSGWASDSAQFRYFLQPVHVSDWKTQVAEEIFQALIYSFIEFHDWNLANANLSGDNEEPTGCLHNRGIALPFLSGFPVILARGFSMY